MQSLRRTVSASRILALRLPSTSGRFLGTTSSLFEQDYVPVKNKIYHERHRGIDVLRNPQINKGMAFTLKERQLMGIHGLLPPTVLTQDQQMVRVMRNIERIEDDLNKYIYLNQLYDRNEKLFYRVLIDHVDKMMPIVYTPTVGEACLKYGLIYRKPRGLFLTIHDAGHLYEIMCNWPAQDVKAIVVTDGERILGLGDLGAFGMGIPVGKLSLYTALAGIAPERCLPVVLDVGTNNKALLNDPLYIGMRHERIQGQAYDDFVEEFMQAAVKRYGQDTLIQFEDFANHNAFRLLEKYRNRYCTFNDDIQGTASVAVAGIIAALRICNNTLSDHTFLFQGAGEASLGIGELLVKAMVLEGTSDEEARSKIWMLDRKGIITTDRPEGSISEHKMRFAKDYRAMTDLAEIVEEIKPTALMGAATVPNVFNEEIIRNMARINERPIIFALSNPTANAECTAEDAYKFSDGRCIFASGSPFDPVTINGKTLYPGQGNNAYIFPGVALGVTVCDVKHITDEVFLTAAHTVANLVTEADLDEGRLYPPLSSIREVSVKIAVEVAKWAYEHNQANLYPKPEDYEKTIREHVYHPAYESFVPQMYEWPPHVTSRGSSYE